MKASLVSTLSSIDVTKSTLDLYAVWIVYLPDTVFLLNIKMAKAGSKLQDCSTRNCTSFTLTFTIPVCHKKQTPIYNS